MPYAFQSGDVVTWNDPDAGACTKTAHIQAITYVNDEVVRIAWEDGGEVEARISELS